MKGFIADIENLTEDNSDFRRVLLRPRATPIVQNSIFDGKVTEESE
jgi:hypothetical protein